MTHFDALVLGIPFYGLALLALGYCLGRLRGRREAEIMLGGILAALGFRLQDPGRKISEAGLKR